MILKKIFRDNNYPIIIDQEGGRVSRLNKIMDFGLFFTRIFWKHSIKMIKIIFLKFIKFTLILCVIF